MKKGLFVLCVGMLAAGCLIGCGQEKQNVTHITKYPSKENTAVEVAQSESEEDLKKQEEERKDETEKRYAIYKSFGMTYDRDKDLFFYNGEVVRYFKDVVSLSTTNGFSYKNGKVDLTATRDEKGNLKSLVKAAQEEFDQRTARWEEQEMESSVGEIATTACYEGGNADDTANALDEYEIYGVSYDRKNEYWVYNEKPIHIFYDEQGCILSDGSVLNGVNIKVIRGVSGKIEKLSEVTDEEINKLLERN
ncbi:MAG: hypothetical protein PHS82_12260 [Lachnospiraceae bacterium]|nr:hypothetical protein [Lachnospiraceae bacterium]